MESESVYTGKYTNILLFFSNFVDEPAFIFVFYFFLMFYTIIIVYCCFGYILESSGEENETKMYKNWHVERRKYFKYFIWLVPSKVQWN